MPLKVTILGSASAKPTVNRHPSAQIVNANEQYFLVDAGEGVQQQMFRNGINPLKLRAVFISHLHGDHVYGLFPLLSTLGLYGRQTPLMVYAPHPFGEILECHRRYFDQHVPYEVIWHEVDTTKHELLFESRSLEVWSIPLRHSLPAAGYLFREKAPELNVDKFKIERYGLSIAQIVAAKRGEDIALESGEVLPNSMLTYLPAGIVCLLLRHQLLGTHSRDCAWSHYPLPRGDVCRQREGCRQGARSRDSCPGSQDSPEGRS